MKTGKTVLYHAAALAFENGLITKEDVNKLCRAKNTKNGKRTAQRVMKIFKREKNGLGKEKSKRIPLI
jgi:hypothetical protein